jgi:hypothetical protein
MGRENTCRNARIQKMDPVLKEFMPEELHWKVPILPDESHNSVRLKGINDCTGGIQFP